jgi:hypothetical protein
MLKTVERKTLVFDVDSLIDVREVLFTACIAGKDIVDTSAVITYVSEDEIQIDTIDGVFTLHPSDFGNEYEPYQIWKLTKL